MNHVILNMAVEVLNGVSGVPEEDRVPFALELLEIHAQTEEDESVDLALKGYIDAQLDIMAEGELSEGIRRFLSYAVGRIDLLRNGGLNSEARI